MSQTNVLLVGLGDVAATHLAVLESHEGVDVVGCVDADDTKYVTWRGRAMPASASIDEANPLREPDLVIVATPTPTHAQVCETALTAFPDARVLVEKPAATRWTDARRLLCDGADRITVALHMAFSPEVLWGARIAGRTVSTFGPPVAIEVWAADPYAGELDAAAARLGDSWIDSGINMLSILERFVEVTHRHSLRKVDEGLASTFHSVIECRTQEAAAEAAITTTWSVTAAAKHTRITYEAGATLLMDHTAVAATLRKPDGTVEVFGTTGDVPRRESHYRGLYSALLGRSDHLLQRDVACRLHRVLLDEH